MPNRPSGSTRNEIGRDIITVKRINGAVARCALNASVYHPADDVCGAADRNISNQTTSKRKSRQATSHGSSGYASRQLTTVDLAPVATVLEQLGV